MPGARSAGLALALGIACLLSVAGWVGIAAATVGVIAPRLLRRRRRFVRGLDRLGARGLELPALVTATCFGVAGLLLAWRPYGSGAYAAGSVPVQLLMVLALTALLASVSTGGSGEPAEASASHGDSAA